GPVDELTVHPDLLEFLHEKSPLAGGLGRTGFYPCALSSTSPVLVPRQEVGGLRAGQPQQLGRRETQEVPRRLELEPDSRGAERGSTSSSRPSVPEARRNAAMRSTGSGHTCNTIRAQPICPGWTFSIWQSTIDGRRCADPGCVGPCPCLPARSAASIREPTP